MIGHYVNNLSDEQSDRLLLHRVGQMEGIDLKGSVWIPMGNHPGCILQVAAGSAFAGLMWWAFSGSPTGHPCADPGHCQTVAQIGRHYDRLLKRFGVPRLNAAIRNRVLSNRARRVLGSVEREAVTTP